MIVLWIAAGLVFTQSMSALPGAGFSRQQLEAAAALPYPSNALELNHELLHRVSRFYTINIDPNDYVLGSIEAPSGSLFLHSLIQEDAIGTVIILHGYLDHSALMKPLIRFFLERNYSVHCLDLPGHGLSGGTDASIQDFHHYGQALEYGLIHFPYDKSKPLILVGHSTGAAAILEYLYAVDPKPAEPDKIILLAPLIRNRFWEWAWIGTHAFSPFPLESLRGFAGTATRNEEAIQLAEIDPLRRPYTKLSWVRSLIDWDRKNRDYGSLFTEALILQGDADRVLDVDYNLQYLQKRIINGTFHIIPGAEHNLHQETGRNKDLILQLMDDFLARSSSF
ncbi:hypothetical protein JCM12856_05560 [Spirochaeta dissipatitropha]